MRDWIYAGPKLTDLYGKFTWKIENFSEISKRELRSNVFEVGGYKWWDVSSWGKYAESFPLLAW
jgi:hypothetical protein